MTALEEGLGLIEETLATPVTPTLTVGGLLVAGGVGLAIYAAARFGLKKIGVLN